MINDTAVRLTLNIFASQPLPWGRQEYIYHDLRPGCKNSYPLWFASEKKVSPCKYLRIREVFLDMEKQVFAPFV